MLLRHRHILILSVLRDAQDVVKRQIQAKLAYDVSLLDQKVLEQVYTYYRLVALWLVRSADPDNKGYACAIDGISVGWFNLASSRLLSCSSIRFCDYM